MVLVTSTFFKNGITIGHSVSLLSKRPLEWQCIALSSTEKSLGVPLEILSTDVHSNKQVGLDDVSASF